MEAARTALLLVGFQNDFFAADGAFRDSIDGAAVVPRALRTTLRLLHALAPSDVAMVATPIRFTATYEELRHPVGILAAIRDAGAFRLGHPGAETIDELRRMGDRVVEVGGKRGFDAFVNTELDALLRARGIRDVVLAGGITSLCVDSTGRSAYERGYRVTVLSDCTVARTPFEQRFFCDSIFPTYADVLDADAVIEQLAPPAGAVADGDH